MTSDRSYKMCVLLKCVLYFGLIINWTSAESCDRKSTCSCECSGGVIDLSSLKSSDGPKYKDELDSVGSGFKYSYNPCTPFTETSQFATEDHCQNVAACQVIDLGGTFQYYDTGTQDSVKFYTADGPDVGIPDEGEVVVAKYTSADQARQTELVLVCNTDDDSTAFLVVGELPDVAPTYRFVLVSPEACFVNAGLSAGSILLIVFVSVLFVYLVGMLVYGKFVRKSSGKDLIPHREFWLGVPGLVKDGTFFIFRRKIGVGSERVPLKS